MTENTRDCKHGQLARSCEICELERRNAEQIDALDHIMRTARNTIQPTRRLDWIALRAKYAIEGKPWSTDVAEEPRDRVGEQENLRKRLRESESRNAELTALLREAREYLAGTGHSPRLADIACEDCKLLARIDSALEGK